MLAIIIILVVSGIGVWRWFDPFKDLPSVLGAKFIPCMVSPWALSGKIIQRIQNVARYQGGLLQIGRYKIGVLNRHLAVQVLANPNMLKVPVKTSNPMIKYGLPFVSNPTLASSLRSTLLATSLNRSVLSRVLSQQVWDSCLNKFVTEIEDIDIAIENFVVRTLFLLVLELPEVEKLPQMQTGPAARERMISSIIGDHPVLKTLVMGYRKLFGMPGIDPDVSGTMRFMESLIDRKVSMAVRMEEQGFTREQIKCHLATLFQAGTETTAFALKVAIICLGRYSQVQEDLYEKIALLDNYWTYTDLITVCPEILEFVYASLNYLTPIPLLRGRVSNTDVNLNGQVFPAGTVFAISNDFIMQPFTRTFDIHDARRQNLSFGYGSRACPGRRLAEIELCMALSVLIKNFKVVDVEPTSNLEDECLSFITRYWSRAHPLVFITRESQFYS